MSNYIQQKMEMPWEDVLEPLYQGIKGNPLILELLRWRGRRDLMKNTQRLREIVETPDVMAQEIFDKISKNSPLNRVLWAMAVFKRRFDFDMLEFLVDNMLWLRNADYEVLRHALRELPFVKSADDVSSHLLHDAVVESISSVFNQVDQEGRLRKELFQKIVREYYDERIQDVQAQDEQSFLKTEQVGYILDQNLEEGIAQYRSYLKDIQQHRQYDFEALLWGEVDEHLPAKNVDLRFKRAEWLVNNGLYRALETLSRSIDKQNDLEIKDKLTASQYMGFALMRQGKLQEAKDQFNLSLSLAQQLQSDAGISETQNNLGQLAVRSGDYAKAATHYWKSIQTFSDFDALEKLGSIYSNQSKCLAMQGDYQRAIMHCTCALKILEKTDLGHDRIRRRIFAFIYTGVVYRLSGDYTTTIRYLKQGRKSAEQENIIELEAEALQELGHTYYLRGRRAREERHDYTSDCGDQWKAWETLRSAIERARTTGDRIRHCETILLLAKAVEEIALLEQAKTVFSQQPPEHIKFSVPLTDTLLTQIQKEPLAEEEEQLRHGDFQHFSELTLGHLTGLKKAARFFEIGALEASDIRQESLELESRSELARVLLELREFDEVKKCLALMRQQSSEITNGQTALALHALIQADFDFDQGHLNAALTRYAQAMPQIVTARWTVTNLTRTRIDELVKRIRRIPDMDVALDWCRALQQSWSDANMEKVFPYVLERIQMLSHELQGEFSL